MKKYKIFISGVQKELKEERFAVKEIITENYLLSEYFTAFLFEDLPAKSKAAEKIYLDEVKDSDTYIGIFGNEYGKLNKDGLSATEKEYIEAKKLEKEILIFIKNDDSKRDDKLKSLLSKIKDNTKGHCYERFNIITEIDMNLEQYFLEIYLLKHILILLDLTSDKKRLFNMLKKKVELKTKNIKRSQGYLNLWQL